ncbi:MAG TPA: BREX protein BrxB domain-containing protein [Anaerolineae bacterium]|nr:BREX protein BrxB domain-containing protein [Anaerolineae bacterium]
MSSLDDSPLERDFQELRAVLGKPDRLNPAHSDPIYYFVYKPEYMLTVKHRLPGWMGLLRHDGFEPVRVSLGDIVRELIDESSRWPEWLELEADAEQSEINQAVRDVLTKNNALVNRVAARIAAGNDKAVILLTESELLHPYFRTRAIESALTGRVPHPTVIFYPGRRVGQYGLHFLGYYPEDPNYRSTLIGGL